MRRAKSPGQQAPHATVVAPFPFGSCEWEEEDDAALATAAESGWPMSLAAVDAPGPAAQRWEMLDLTGMSLNSVAPAIARFTNVTSLFLSYNPGLGALPEAILQMRQLRCLHAASCGLSALPAAIDRLVELRELDVSNNAIRTLPLELGRLWRLLHLNVDGNPLEFPAPSVVAGGPLLIVEYLRDRLSLPPPPPKRAWRMCEQLSPDDIARPLLRVMTFNVLAESYGTPEQYAYCPSWALGWEFRQKKILDEIAISNADVVCLQEVEGQKYLDFFHPTLQQAGYASIFKPKSRARTRENWTAVDGCAIFFRLSKLRLLEEHLIEYQSISLDRFRDLKGDRSAFDRLMLKDNIALVGLFEIPRPSPTLVLIANTHIHWDPSNSDLKLMQVQFMLEELAKTIASPSASVALAATAPGRKIALIVAGDFNATPSSGVYQLLRDGKVPPNHPDFNGSNFGRYTSEGLHHDFSLRSAYAAINEPEYTNHSGDFTGVLDYLWYATDTVRVLQALDVVPLSDLLQLRTPLPNPHFPSDHVSLLADFQLR